MEGNNYEKRISEKLDEAFKKEDKSFWGFFIKKYRFTYLILLLVVLLGFYSMFTLPREAEPEIKVPYAVISTVYLGATPTDIEELITDKIEEKIENLEGLKQSNSSSGQGYSSVFVEFEAEADLSESIRKLKDAVDESVPSLPDESESPVVTEINFNDFPIVTYSLVGDYSDQELKKYADDLQERLEKIKDVSEVPIRGGLEREYQVIVDQTKLANYRISLGQIVNAIQSTNFSLPSGDIEIDNLNYNIRVDGRFLEAYELNDIVISTYDNSPVFLRDVALVKDGYKDKETESHLGLGQGEVKNTISLQIYKKTGGNILNIVDEANSVVDQINKDKEFADDLTILKTNDNSWYIRDDLKTLGTSGIQTIILIFLILLLVLSFRGAIITAMSVPIAFLMSFYFLKVEGMTLNSMVLFSLVLSLGLMVDNAIVIIEGINEYITRHKKSVYEASILAVWNFKWAIIAGTTTTVAAFLPMLLVSGIMGEYMGILPKTISVTLLSSLFVALVVIPTLSARFIKVKTNGDGSHRNARRHKIVGAIMSKLQYQYAGFMRKILPNKKNRRRLLVAVWVIFLIAIIMPYSGIMQIAMFPKIDMDYFSINIKLPIGKSIEKTKTVTKEVEDIVSNLPELDNFVTTIGSSAVDPFGGGGDTEEHLASITVNLVDDEKRERKSIEIAEDLRDKLKIINGAEITVDEMTGGPPTGSPVEVRIYGEDQKEMAILVDQIKEYFTEKQGVINIRDSLKESTGDFTFTVDKQKANYYGLNITSIASTIRNAVYGTKATAVNVGGEDIDVIVKYDKDEFSDINDLENILLFTPNGNISLKQVAKLKLEPSLLEIDHRDGKNIATITADTEEGANAKLIMDEFLEYKDQITLPEGFSIDIGGETEDIQRSFTEIFLSLGVAIIIIAFILVLMFNSFKQPFIIIFALPLALIGVIFGLTILGQPFSITSFVGVVALAGIAVNDAIVLIDRINKNIKDGMDFTESIIEGGVARMQPIFITSITTIAGVFPLIFANEMWVGFSLAVIFGLLTATPLTLIIVPTYYAGFNRKGK